MSGSINRINATAGGTVFDTGGHNVITAGTHAATVTAWLGTDTIQGGSGALYVDAGENYNDVTVLAGAGPLDFMPGEGTNSVIGGIGRVTVEAGFQGFEGGLAYVGGTGAATVTGYIDTTITGGTGAEGTVFFLQNGPATVIGGAGTVTIYTDGNQLTVKSPDGSHSTTWMPDTHVTLQVTGNGSSYTLTRVNGIDGTAGGVVADTAGNNWVSLGGAASTVTAARGTDTIQAGTGDLTVDATGNAQTLVVQAGPGVLRVRPGTGAMRIVGQSGQIAVASGSYWSWSGTAGDTVVIDHDANRLVRLTDAVTGAVYTFGPAGIINGTGTVSGGGAQRVSLLAGEGASLLYGAMLQSLTTLLPATSQYVAFTAGQTAPTGPNVVAGMSIPANASSGRTVTPGVPVVINRLPGNYLLGNGAANQFVVSSTGFTYHANGGSGVVLADDIQAGGRAGDNHIVLAPSGGGDFAISTGAGDDTIEASTGNDTIATGAGRNITFLGAGTALVYTGGSDTVVSGNGAVTVNGTANLDSLVFGGNGRLTFIGGQGAATVVSGNGPASLAGGAGDSVFWGSINGYTTIHSGSGNGTLVGGGGGNLIYAGGWHDELLVAGFGSSTIVGTGATGNNFYWGSFGDDLLIGDAGNDTIIGGPGHDTVHAGSGGALIFGGWDGNVFQAGPGARDTVIVTGGGAASTFIFVDGASGGHETIWGFRPGVDHVALQGYAAGTLETALAYSYGVGLGTGITLADGTTIVFGNVTGLTPSLLS